MVLAGATPGFQTFLVGVADTNQTYYTILNEADQAWEVGIGTYSAGGNSLNRDTVLASSNANSPVNFAAGTKTVFATVAAQFFGAALTAVSHATLDHTGILGVPGAETFTAAVHDTVDHTSGPFNLLDAAGHQGIDHTAGPFNLLDEPAHDLLDHTGLTGVNSFDSAAHAATDHAGLPGIDRVVDFVYDNVTTTGSQSVTIPANTLTADGQAIEIYAANRIGTMDSWTAAGVGALPTLAMPDTGIVRWTLVRTGATQAFWTNDRNATSGGFIAIEVEEPVAVDWSIAQTITLNFSTGGTAARIILRAVLVR